MGFFDNIGKAISDVSNSTFQKGKDAVSIAKYNRMISDEEKEASKAFEKLGRLYYESHTEDFEAGFAQIIDDINSSKARIKEYQDILDDLQGIVKCSQCGAGVPETAAFCPECGAKIIKREPEEIKEHEPGKLYCTECGAEITPGTKFCMACGTKVEILDDIEPECEEQTEEISDAAPECIDDAVQETENAVEDAADCCDNTAL